MRGEHGVLGSVATSCTMAGLLENIWDGTTLYIAMIVSKSLSLCPVPKIFFFSSVVATFGVRFVVICICLIGPAGDYSIGFFIVMVCVSV